MKTNGKHEVMARIARQSLVLAALLVLVLSAAGISRAQSSAIPPATPAAKSAAPAKTPASPAAKPPAKGSHEGITVHGHWTIEVRNPDGKLVSHREFENALLQQGQAILTDLLSGNYLPGAWNVELCTSGGLNSCDATDTFSPTFVMMLVQAGGFASSPSCSSSGLVLPGYGTLYCWPGLPSAKTLYNINNTLTLMGTVPSSPVSASIDTVESQLVLCNSPAVSPTTQAGCLASLPQGQLSTAAYFFDFTGKSLSPTISVQQYQAISVTVTFSFGSST